MHATILDDDHLVRPLDADGMHLQNPYCVACALDGALLARQGAMVAYRGDLQFRTKGQGLKKLVKRAVTGEGLALMEIEGRGEVWLADLAKHVFVLALEPGGDLSVNGRNVLGFDATVGYEIGMVKGAGMTGGGLFNCTFSGAGSLAVTAHGQPLALPVTADDPVRVDTDAVIAWTAALDTAIHTAESMRSRLKGGSGEGYQLELRGEGVVLVQPSEGPVEAKGDGGLADAVGELLGG